MSSPIWAAKAASHHGQSAAWTPSTEPTHEDGRGREREPGVAEAARDPLDMARPRERVDDAREDERDADEQRHDPGRKQEQHRHHGELGRHGEAQREVDLHAGQEREGEHERDGGAGGDGRGRSGQRERGRGDEERGRHREVDPALRARRALDHPAAGVVERALGVGGDRQRSQAFAQLRNAAHAPVIGRAARTLRRFVRGRPGLDEWRIERPGRRADLVGAPPGCVLERKGCLT